MIRVSRNVEVRELAVFLLLVVPSMILSFFAVKTGTLGFVTTAFATILRDTGLVALVWLFLWKNGEPLESIGLSSRSRWREIVLGGALYFVLAPVVGSVESLLHAAGISEPSTNLPNFLTVTGNAELILAVILVAVVAMAEEILFRGYLIRRIAAITGSTGAAVILSSILFALGHGYEGTIGVLTVGVTGLCFALVYLWRGSLVAPVTMHFILDFIGIVAMPLWKAHF
jgi:membrane protease YdiL (CAAX protease family)